MRSKSMAERPKAEDKADICASAGRALPTPGVLSLVRGAQVRPVGAMKPGLY